MNLTTRLLLILLLIIIFLVIAVITKKAIIRFSILKSIEAHRRKIIIGLSYFVYYILVLFILLLILGVDAEQFAFFASSVLAVLGVGFFAQWSILSNITASVILFFYHPLRIGSKIRILDSEINLTGTVEDISGFYVLLKTDDNRIITIPNSIILYKGIELLNEKSSNIDI